MLVLAISVQHSVKLINIMSSTQDNDTTTTKAQDLDQNFFVKTRVGMLKQKHAIAFAQKVYLTF